GKQYSGAAPGRLASGHRCINPDTVGATRNLQYVYTKGYKRNMKQALSAEIRSQLVRIAEGRLAHARNTKDWVDPVNYTVLGVELYGVACEVSGVESVSDPEILPTFFTEDAVAVLMTMPSQYWFWTIFQESVTSESDEVARVRVEMVRHVMVHRQRSASIQ